MSEKSSLYAEGHRADTISDQVFDVLVIGGGINGCGIALDAARRGYSVLLVERKDYGAGTTSASTRLIHGGLRYLEFFEFGLVRESLREREILLHTAGNLVRPLPLMLPIYRGARHRRWMIRLGLLFYEFFSLGKSLPRHRILSAAEIMLREPTLRREGLCGGAAYFDCQISFPERLCAVLIQRAREAGARAMNYTEVVGLHVQEFPLRADLYDSQTGEQTRARARVVVNAAGPWVDQVRRLAGELKEPLMGGTKGSHIIVPRRPGGPKNAVYVEARQDGRPIFVIPWLNFSLIGTTDLPYTDDLDAVVCSPEEAAYLLQEVQHLFPAWGLGPKDILYTYSGVRPLPRARTDRPGAITRRHHIVRNKAIAPPGGYFDIIGGKLTTYRSLAEEAVDKLGPLLGRRRESHSTRRLPLFGDSNLNSRHEALRAICPGLPESAYQHLERFYGGDAAAVLRLAAEQPALQAPICAHAPDILAQAVYAVLNEQALHVEDILMRRTSVGWRACLGLDCCEGVARLIAPLLQWDGEQIGRELRRYREHVFGRFLPDFLHASNFWKERVANAG